MAASATFALKAGVWFRRARLLIVSPDSRVNLARRQAETPLIPLFRFLRPALPSNRPKLTANYRTNPIWVWESAGEVVAVRPRRTRSPAWYGECAIDRRSR